MAQHGAIPGGSASTASVALSCVARRVCGRIPVNVELADGARVSLAGFADSLPVYRVRYGHVAG
eukprot:3391849-Prymnesium_polylepis.2